MRTIALIYGLFSLIVVAVIIIASFGGKDE